MTRLFWNRGVLVVGALVCLCLSDSVGPRLLPLPASTVLSGFNPLALDSGLWASQAPNHKREPNTHMEMAAGSQYRARDRHHHVQPATHVPQASLQLQPIKLVGAPETYAPLKSNTASLSLRPGRAPPHLA